MSVLLKVSAGGVPVGSYVANFVGIEPTSNEFGEGLKWEFEVASGPHKGQKTSRMTTNIPSLKNAAGKILAGLVGHTLTPGEQIDPVAYKGKPYLIVVAATDKGSTRIESVSPPPVE